MKRKRKESRWYAVLFISMIGFSGILVTINVFTFLIFPLIGKPTFTYEQAAVQNILSAFSMAVSVWIGLSIAERLDRGTILQLKEQAGDIEEQLVENEKINIQLLLNDLQINQTDAIAQLAIQKIQEIATNTFPSNVWVALREEEQILRELQNTRTSGEAKRIFQRYEGFVKEIKLLIAKNENQEAAKKINEILDLRMMKAQFFMGDITEGKDAAAFFIDCVESFWKNSEQFGIEVSDIPSKYVLKTDDAEELLDSDMIHEKCDWGVYAYLFNFIGESYSRITHHNNRCAENDRVYPRKMKYEKCKNLALNYCILAIASAKRGKVKSEVYYRNYGCAIERANYFNFTEDILWEAVEQYKKSFQICSGQRLSYYCLASAYNKIFEARTGLKRSMEKEDMTELQLNRYAPQKMDYFFNEYGQLIHLYIMCFPTEINAHRMVALYYRNRYLYYGREKDNVKNLKFHLDVMEEMDPSIKENEEYRQSVKICKKERDLWNRREN